VVAQKDNWWWMKNIDWWGDYTLKDWYACMKDLHNKYYANVRWDK
jgi:hypothetical protein